MTNSQIYLIKKNQFNQYLIKINHKIYFKKIIVFCVLCHNFPIILANQKRAFKKNKLTIYVAEN
ncbi:MAG: hypothetical protein CMI87_00415 [Pelagibacteraceae bacterium]|nr:hypothetical protein [Pelagibacteraceae bacterium]